MDNENFIMPSDSECTEIIAADFWLIEKGESQTYISRKFIVEINH